MRRKNAGGKPLIPDGMNLGPGILKKASGGGGNNAHAQSAVRKPGGGTGVAIEAEAGECQSVLGGSLRKRLLPAAVQDEGKPGKLGQTDAVRKAVRLRKVTRIPCCQQRFSPDREGGQIFSFKRGADDGKLQQVRMKLLQKLVGVGFKQLKGSLQQLIFLGPRSNRRQPNSFSSCFICALRGGWDRFSFLAAPEMVPSFTTVTNS